MTARPVVLHLVDDTTAGGVMRVVDFLVTSGRLAAGAQHITQQITRGSLRAERLKADIIVSHLTLNWRGLPGLIALRAANVHTPMIHVEHSYTEGFVAQNVARPARFEAMLRIGYAMFNGIVAVSIAQAAWISARKLCNPAKVTVIASCVDLSDFRALPRRTGPLRVLGAIGRLERQKGFDTLITAFRALPEPDVALHFYGQGAEEDTLRALAAGDSRIHFKGFCDTPTAAYTGVDAVIMPSRWEAYGLVAIEALSARRPVLCAATDGLTDHGANGAHIANLRTVSEITTALTKLLSKPAQDVAASEALEDVFLCAWEALVADSRMHGAEPRTEEMA